MFFRGWSAIINVQVFACIYATIVISTCVTLGVYAECMNILPGGLKACTWIEYQILASLGFGLFLGGGAASMSIGRQTYKMMLMVSFLLLLAVSSMIRAVHTCHVMVWWIAAPLCTGSILTGAIFARAAGAYRALECLDKRVVVVLMWICTAGVAGLLVSDAYRRNIRTLRVTTFFMALIPIALIVLGLLGAAHSVVLQIYIGREPKLELQAFVIINYLISVFILRQHWLKTLVFQDLGGTEIPKQTV